MEQREVKASLVAASASDMDVRAPEASDKLGANLLSPQACPNCGTEPATNGGAAAPSYVYSIGRIEPRFPRLSVEKELVQATGRADTAGLTDRQALHAVLSKPENRYLVRQVCWVCR